MCLSEFCPCTEPPLEKLCLCACLSVLSQMCVPEEIPYQRYASPHARDPDIKRASLYEDEMV